MENRNQDSPKDANELLGYKKEVQIAILAIVGSLGFFKVDELKAFISVLASLVVSDIDKNGHHDYSVYLFSGIGALGYLLYFLAFAYALIQTFQSNKSITKTVLVSISAYFVMYFFVVVLVLRGPYDNATVPNPIESHLTSQDTTKSLNK